MAVAACRQEVIEHAVRDTESVDLRDGKRLTEGTMDPKAHWKKFYGVNRSTEVSWYQPSTPLSSRLIYGVAPELSAAIIDAGGGASTLVDGLLAEGYSNVTVLDVSAEALAACSARLGAGATQVRWLEGNVLDVSLPAAAYDVWHDRALFHFLTDSVDRKRYVSQVLGAVKIGGHVIVATFAADGPAKCSGLPVARFSPQELHGEFGNKFRLIESVREEHRTPANTMQSFTYCVCRVDR